MWQGLSCESYLTEMEKGAGMAIQDTHGRTINYLRLSITESCNLRCLYCVPSKTSQDTQVSEQLSFDEMFRIARAAVDLGVEKIRITGGEPLFNPGVIDFLASLKKLPGLQKLVVTTNGILLEEMAADLRFAGVDSLNISLDSLDTKNFWKITRGGDLNKVMRGVEAAERAGFNNLKFNVVVMRGINDAEVSDFAALTLQKPYKIRFIEHMPTVGGSRAANYTIPGAELLQRLVQNFSLQKVAKDPLDGPAVYYRLDGATGQIGFITPISCHFCHDCNRIRVTSTGMLKGCLFDNGVMNLKQTLASGDDMDLKKALQRAVSMKPLQHSLNESSDSDIPIAMSCIGG